MKFKLYVYPKNIDLICVSAFEAIVNLLNFKSLKRLNKYKLWEIELDTKNKEEGEQIIQTILNKSYYLANPNKEGYYLNQLPPKKYQNSESILYLKVEPQKEDSQKRLIEKIGQKLKTPLTTIKEYSLWEMIISTEDQLDVLKEKLIENVIITTSINKGILVNPLYEKFELLTQNEL